MGNRDVIEEAGGTWSLNVLIQCAKYSDLTCRTWKVVNTTKSSVALVDKQFSTETVAQELVLGYINRIE